MHGRVEYDLYKDTVLILYTLVDYYNVFRIYWSVI